MGQSTCKSISPLISNNYVPFYEQPDEAVRIDNAKNKIADCKQVRQCYFASMDMIQLLATIENVYLQGVPPAIRWPPRIRLTDVLGYHPAAAGGEAMHLASANLLVSISFFAVNNDVRLFCGQDRHRLLNNIVDCEGIDPCQLAVIEVIRALDGLARGPH